VSPPHDIIRGGIHVKDALDIVARGGGEALQTAKRLLEDAL